MDEYEEAWAAYHDSFIKRKNEILSKLSTIRGGINDATYKKWLNQTIEFIKEQKG